MVEQVHAERREPEEPQGAFDLVAGARELLAQAGGLAAGRAARTLTPGAGAPLKQTMLALLEGRELDEHQTPGPATIQVLSGRATLRTRDTELELSEGQWASIPAELHDVRAETDVALLLTVVNPAGT